MKRRFISILLSVSLLLSLSGCASLFKTDYLSVSKYEDNSGSDETNEIIQISSYDELNNVIISMISSHKSERRMRFTDYDGALQSDIAKACSGVKAENAMASYSVDYMSYDISHIANYFEAAVYITYKRTPGEISAISYVSGQSRLIEVVDSALESLSSNVTISIISQTITAEVITAAVNKAYEKNPASCVVPPNVTVAIHPESGAYRIIEIEFAYGWKQTELKKKKSLLAEKIKAVNSSIATDNNAIFALKAYNTITENCVYAPSGYGKNGKTVLNSGLGSTAYGALLEGFADSRGISLAFCALCNSAGIECFAVDGTMDNERHSWNIVKLEDSYYHVDVSANFTLGIGNAFMRNDSQMQDRYIWDAVAYPACSGLKSYSDILLPTF